MRSALTIVAWLAVSSTVSAQNFQFTQIDVPGARLTRPFGLNASGQIVGLFQDASGSSHGFMRNPDDTYTTLDVPGAIFTNASGINARGDVVGRWTDAAHVNHLYLRTSRGDYRTFDPLAPCVASPHPTVAHGINDVGDLVGRCFDADGKELAWLWRHDGSFLILDGPDFLTTDAWIASNRDLVAGDYSDLSQFVHGYLWTEASGIVTVDFPGNQTGIRGVNERGDVTGVYASTGTSQHGFLLRDGVYTTVDYPGSADNSGTLVINDRGLMVGGFIDAAGREHGFIARECPPGGRS
jgi:uncharacterized membrane protein